MRESLRIQVGEERQAIAIAQELVAFGGLDLRQELNGWEVVVDCFGGNRHLIRVLNAVREALSGPADSVVVLLNGRQYCMEGE